MRQPSVPFTTRLRSLLAIAGLSLLGVLSIPVVSAAHRYVVGSSADVAPNAVRYTNIGSSSATAGYVLTADGANNSAWTAVPVTASNLQAIMGASPNATSTVAIPMILNPSSGTAFQATGADGNTVASSSGTHGGSPLILSETGSGSDVLHDVLTVTRTGSGSAYGNLIVGQDNSSASSGSLLLDLKGGVTDRMTLTKGGDLTVSGLASQTGLATDGAGKFVGQAQADATHSGFLGSTDWNTFNAKVGTGVDLPLAGGTMSGQINSQNVFPATDNTYGSGAASFSWASVSSHNFDIDHAGGLIGQLKDDSGIPDLVSGGTDLEIDSSAGNFINLLNAPTETTIGATGVGVSALPALPLGYLLIKLGGTEVAIPYYNH